MMQSEDLWFNAPGCGLDPPQECCTSYGPVQAGGFRPCTSHGCPPNCVSDLYEIYGRTDNRGRGRADADRERTRAASTRGSRDESTPDSDRFENASGCGLWMCDQ